MNWIASAAALSLALAAPPSLTAGQAPQPAAPRPSATSPAAPQAPAGAAAPATPAIPARTFTATAGMLLNTVRPERVADFERVIAYVRAAFEKSTNPGVRAQAAGWRFFKAAEPGPNGTVLYVFLLDPTVAGADYGLGHILAEAYPNIADLQEIWALYTGSVTSGGSLLNLAPVPVVAPLPLGVVKPAAPAPGPATTPAAPPPTVPPIPPDADPNRR